MENDENVADSVLELIGKLKGGTYETGIGGTVPEAVRSLADSADLIDEAIAGSRERGLLDGIGCDLSWEDETLSFSPDRQRYGFRLTAYVPLYYSLVSGRFDSFIESAEITVCRLGLTLNKAEGDGYSLDPDSSRCEFGDDGKDGTIGEALLKAYLKAGSMQAEKKRKRILESTVSDRRAALIRRLYDEYGGDSTGESRLRDDLYGIFSDGQIDEALCRSKPKGPNKKNETNTFTV